MVINNSIKYPRLLVIDSTRTGGLSATGQLKKNLLRDWPEETFMQLHAPKLGYYPLACTLEDHNSDPVFTTEDGLLDKIAAFNPEVLYYRPLLDQHSLLHLLMLKILKRNPVPMVTHIMDDWPARLAAKEPFFASKVEHELRSLFRVSYKALSISEQMSEAFEKRYGTCFEAISNGVDPDLYDNLNPVVQNGSGPRDQVVLRYCGALAKNMNFQSVIDIAQAVDSLQDQLPLKFEVYTMPLWRRSFEEAVKGYRGVFIFDAVPEQDYPRLLAGADILVLAYNYDPLSLTYIQYSMPNKLPEYLASGSPILAVGPPGLPGIDYLTSRQLACAVTSPDFDELRRALKRLTGDAGYRKALGEKGRKWAFQHLNIQYIAARFQQILFKASIEGDKKNSEHYISGSDYRLSDHRTFFKWKIVNEESRRAFQQLSALQARQKKIELNQDQVEPLRSEKQNAAAVLEQLRQEKETLGLLLKKRDLENRRLRRDKARLMQWMLELRENYSTWFASKSWRAWRRISNLAGRLPGRGKGLLKIEGEISEIFSRFEAWKRGRK